jgi:hypothetical protein
MRRPSLFVRFVLLVPLLVASPSCNRRRESAAPAARPAPAEAALPPPALPDRIPGFASDAPVTANGAQQRSYQRPGARVAVTLARFPMDADQYESWVRTSVAGFPQARLDVPDGAGNGFYQCDDHAPASCSLLVQLRSGVHLEIRGTPGSREDVDAVARALPLRALAGPPATAARP